MIKIPDEYHNLLLDAVRTVPVRPESAGLVFLADGISMSIDEILRKPHYEQDSERERYINQCRYNSFFIY
ncbi:hypothetical protein J4221_04320 [Candidatus Pacearchaeota archaeon]|nr:hypothetical protein [Candidatus Pacearchaeota archaeon]